jgi:hypothetical protein
MVHSGHCHLVSLILIPRNASIKDRARRLAAPAHVKTRQQGFLQGYAGMFRVGEITIAYVRCRSLLIGTRQAFVPGGGHRTGPPGKHVIGGKAKYRVMDEKVRYFVSPGSEVLNVSPVSTAPV